MNKFITFSFTLIFISLVFIASSQTLKRDGLNGQVKSVTEYRYGAVNKAGQIQKDYLMSKTLYKYDKNGFLKEEHEFNLIKANKHMLVNVKKFILNEDIIEIHYYDGNNKLKSKPYKAFKLDEKGNLVEFQGPTFSKYDENNNLIEVGITYNEDGKIYSGTINEFDDGTLIESKDFNYGDLGMRCTYNYDGMKLTLKTCYSKNGSLLDNTTYKYDSRSNLIQVTRSPSYSDKEEYTSYGKYDEHGNWRLLVTTEGKFPIIIEREISYYEQ